MRFARILSPTGRDMKNPAATFFPPVLIALLCAAAAPAELRAEPDGKRPAGLTVGWADNYLTIRGPHLPTGEMRVWYIEAYCRPGSTRRDWKETTIGHKTELVSAADD